MIKKNSIIVYRNENFWPEKFHNKYAIVIDVYDSKFVVYAPFTRTQFFVYSSIVLDLFTIIE